MVYMSGSANPNEGASSKTGPAKMRNIFCGELVTFPTQSQKNFQIPRLNEGNMGMVLTADLKSVRTTWLLDNPTKSSWCQTILRRSTYH